jgi:nicotinamidase-related amidase
MPVMQRESSVLAIIDLQTGILPVIEESNSVLQNAKRLVAAAHALSVPIVTTEQNPQRLGTSSLELGENGSLIHKMSFSACVAKDFMAEIADRSSVIIAGIEAHVCVQQTVLDLLKRKIAVFVVRDAIGSRRAESKETALQRMATHGAEVVTTEMVLFEWLGTAEHPKFKAVSSLIR